MNIFVAGGTNHHVAERKARRQVEAECALFAQLVAITILDRQQLGELAPEQRFRLDLEVVR